MYIACTRVCLCVRACVCVCVRAYVLACVRAWFSLNKYQTVTSPPYTKNAKRGKLHYDTMYFIMFAISYITLLHNNHDPSGNNNPVLIIKIYQYCHPMIPGKLLANQELHNC